MNGFGSGGLEDIGSEHVPVLDGLRPRFTRLDGEELLVGMPIGAGAARRVGSRAARGRRHVPPIPGPRVVLEGLVAGALARPPCLVEFSGGRDSSAVLALAAHVARREGLPLPIPFTRRFAHAPATDEAEWQHLVIDHLRLPHWERMVVTEELDLVGPYARRVLLACGVVAPAPLYAALPSFDRARGGTRITGEGGDEILGSRRVTALRRARQEPLTNLLRPRPARRALEPITPSVIRRSVWRRRLGADLELPWLRSSAREQVLDRIARHLASEPLDWRRSLNWHLAATSTQMLAHNSSVLASLYDVTVLDPFLHPSFVASWAREGGFFGVADRTEALRALVPDLLPDAVLSRQSKATFNTGYFTGTSRQFASEWSGRGVDLGMVDPERLVEEWRHPRPSAQSFALLQTAWLADHGGDRREELPG